MFDKQKAVWFLTVAATLSLPVVAQNERPEPRLLCGTAFTIAAHSSKDCAFTVTQAMGAAKIEGRFRATGGPRNSIEVWVLDDDAFVNWRNHHHVTPLYNSEKVTQGTLDLVLPRPGRYHIIFNNDFSVMTPKAIEANVTLESKLPPVENN